MIKGGAQMKEYYEARIKVLTRRIERSAGTERRAYEEALDNYKSLLSVYIGRYEAGSV